MTAGFIAPQNLSLCQIVDLPGGSAANIDESRAGEWGPATIAALKSFDFDVSRLVRCCCGRILTAVQDRVRTGLEGAC
jgi:hypothetical protein